MTWNNCTKLQGLTCYRGNRSLPSYHDANGKQVSCCHCPFLPCRSCCPCGILSKGMPEFSSELSLLSDLAEGVGSQQRIPFDKTARHAQPCVCSIHMTLVTGQSVCLAVLFQVHQHSFPLPLSPPRTDRLHVLAAWEKLSKWICLAVAAPFL